jgi:hypothetical protein
MILGAVLFVTKKKRMAAIVCLIAGAVLIAIPPILVVMTSM